MKSIFRFLVLLLVITACGTETETPDTVDNTGLYNEPHRPQIHFSPKEKWMNDPNGMVFFNNQYHMFYQYYPDSSVWGPMHWGHATSTDMVHWEHQPVALYPDSLGYIFSGSAVVDVNNTSGLGKNGQTPLVAIFTHHEPNGEKTGSLTFQNQSIAYSLDNGKMWTKYANNPVLRNPGIKDFRDPKVSWYEPGKKWIMALAVMDHIEFYSSPDLKEWKKESELGKDFGAHGGVWECPDLFPIKHGSDSVWILVVSINPGGPNGGSATQYFTGQFDGSKFVPYQTDIRWLDYGPDNYAGVTWSNTGDRRIFYGWMSNWQYAQVVPTDKWRSAMSIPRDLGLDKIGDKYFITSKPVPELKIIEGTPVALKDIDASNYSITENTGEFTGAARLDFTSSQLRPFTITLSNNGGEKVTLGYDSSSKSYFIDRTNSGKVSFEKGFAAKHTATRLATTPNMDMTLIIDNASVELFADKGLTAMTQIFFPNKPFTHLQVSSTGGFKMASLTFTPLKSIWR